MPTILHREINAEFTNFLTDKPFAYGKVRIRLSANDYTLLQGIPKYDKLIGLDKNGKLSAGLKLFCNGSFGLEGTFYEVTEPDGTTWTFVLFYGDGTKILLHTLRGGSSVPENPETVIQIVENKVAFSAVRFDIEQSLDEDEQAQGRANLGLEGDIGGTVDQTIINGSSNAVSGNAVFDALANISSGGGGVGSLLFNKDQIQHVNHGRFWTPGEEYSHFFWEFSAKPKSAVGGWTGYLVSDGFGGSHNLLFGIQQSGSFYKLTANIWNGTSLTSFDCVSENIKADQWAHLAIGWDGADVMMWVNGVLSFVQPYANVRKNVNDGVLFIGGSDHLNFHGNIAQVRGYEGTESCRYNSDFAPERYFRPSFSTDSNTFDVANFIANYQTPATIFPNYGKGHQGRNNTGVKGNYSGSYADRDVLYFPQTQVASFESGEITDSIYAPNPPAIPAGAIIFDSFSRPDSTKANGKILTLGQTEGGSAGIKTWLQNGSAVLNGQAYMLYNNTGYSRLAFNGSNYIISVTKPSASYVKTGIEFRRIDDNNWQRLAIDPATNAIVYDGVNAGVYFSDNLGVFPSPVTKLEMRLNGTVGKIFINGSQFGADRTVPNQGGFQFVGITDRSHSTKQVWRYDDFTVSPSS